MNHFNLRASRLQCENSLDNEEHSPHTLPFVLSATLYKTTSFLHFHLLNLDLFALISAKKVTTSSIFVLLLQYDSSRALVSQLALHGTTAASCQFCRPVLQLPGNFGVGVREK